MDGLEGSWLLMDTGLKVEGGELDKEAEEGQGSRWFLILYTENGNNYTPLYYKGRRVDRLYIV